MRKDIVDVASIALLWAIKEPSSYHFLISFDSLLASAA